MKKLFRIRSINQASALSIILVAFLTLFVVTFILYTLHKEYGKEIANIEERYLHIQKELIKKETKRALDFIAYKHKKDGRTKSRKELQSEIVDAIEQMRNERDGTGYIFIYTFDGVNIADPILKENAGKNLLHVRDVKGKEVIKELIEVSQLEEGGYVEYFWNKPLTNHPAPKISYAASYKPWRWRVGSGVYLDDVYKEIEKKKFAHRNRVSKFIVGILSIATFLFIFGMLIYRYFAMTITSDIDYIQQRLSEASKKYEALNLSEIRYEEFSKIAGYINQMLHEIKEQKEALEDLNLNLEKRVAQKTEKLRIAKEFAEEVVQSQDRFIKNAIHEINTPLSIILTNIDLYNIKNPKNRYLTKIEAGVKIIHNIYNDLSYVAKKDHVSYPRSELDFSKLLHRRLDFFNEVAVGNRVALQADIARNIRIVFNETELQRICDNTISNAIKYSLEATFIIVRLSRKEGYVLLEIINRGEEIAEPEKLFERYYREHVSRGGFGIGLNIVKEICDKYDIKIEVDSEKGYNYFRYYFKDNDENSAA